MKARINGGRALRMGILGLSAAALAALFAWGCGARPSEVTAAQQEKNQPQKVREAAVAGLFYPKEKAELAQMLDRLLKAAPVDAGNGELKALICPHAGYVYSGPTAAFAYKLLAGKDYETVIVLAPSHYALFTGASVAASDAYRTPLGLVPISAQAKHLAAQPPFVLEPRCSVQRPGWWQQSPKTAPDPGQDTPDTWEHSAEVQVPFLQASLKQFNLLPVVIGKADPAQIAGTLAAFLNNRTLLVASSDLSHYHPYEQAKSLDSRCVKAICELDLSAMQEQEACGALPILAVMRLARQNGWKPRLLDYRNSGDTAGDKSGVVGYAAIAFYLPEQETYTAAERKQLLALARQTLKEVVTNSRLPNIETNKLPSKFFEQKGCFVTLTKDGVLRGCIGHILPQESLYQAIMDNARNAAMHDPRFTPVRPEELDRIALEVSVLTRPQPMAFSSADELLRKLQPHRDGVVLRIGPRGSTYLPQVWEQLPDKTEFMNQLAEKAGCKPNAWREPGATVFTYQAAAFKESEK